MKTVLTPISELNPGDKVYVEWPADLPKPANKLPDILTVREVFLGIGTVTIRESGGLCLKAPELFKVMDIVPVEGDLITFEIQTWDQLGLMTMKECRENVRRIDVDPLKKRESKCLVTVAGEDYGIPFSEIKSIQKKQPQQLSMF